MLKGLSLQGQKLFGLIVKGVGEGASGNRILKGLREAGLGYRAQDFYRDLNIVKEAAQKWNTLKYYSKNIVIREEAYRPTTAPLLSNYSTKCRFTYVNPETGERVQRYFTIGHDVRMSPSGLADYVDRYKENFEKGDSVIYDWDLVEILPIAGYRKG